MKRLSSPEAKAGAEALTSLLKALGEGNRLRILELLRRGETCVCEMVEALDLPQNLISHHLGVLKRQGLVLDRRDSRDARWVHYSLNPEALRRLRAALWAFLDPDAIGSREASCPTPRDRLRP